MHKARTKGHKVETLGSFFLVILCVDLRAFVVKSSSHPVRPSCSAAMGGGTGRRSGCDRRRRRAGGHVTDEFAEVRSTGVGTRTRAGGPQLSRPGFGPHRTRQHPRLPAGPVPVGVGQGCVPRDEAEGAAAPGAHAAASGASPPEPGSNHTRHPGGAAAEVHVLVIEEERFVETAELFEARAPHEQTAAGDPFDGPAGVAAVGPALPPAPAERATRPGCGRTWGKRPGRRLAGCRRGSGGGTRSRRRRGSHRHERPHRVRRRGTRRERSRPGSRHSTPAPATVATSATDCSKDPSSP